MVGPLLPLFLLQAVREVCRPGASLTLATGHSRLYALCGVAMLPLTVVAVLIGTRGGITGVSWAMLIAVGGASLVWPGIACAVLRPPAAALGRTLGVPLLLAAATASVVALSRAALDAAGMPAPVRLVVAALAGLVVFLLVVWRCWPSLRVDVNRLRETLPDDGGQSQPAVAALQTELAPARADERTAPVG